MPLIDAAPLKPLIENVERTKAEWARLIDDPSAPVGAGRAEFHLALYELAGAITSLIEAAEAKAPAPSIH